MPAKALMIVGTTSHSGKSLTATAFCRLFHEMGYSVAPFKAQNMSNNSFVTREGGEMGRAQVGQAEAAGVEPHVDMNPVLLKPTTDQGSQVIVHGRPIGTMQARNYYELRDQMWQAVTESYARLAEKYDIIVMEGAGSPVEINIRHKDIVNMEMALHAQAPTILVADIERGGVFASVVGTYRLLREDEWILMVGTIVNKFRGDITLFEEGRHMLAKESDKPCLGVMPYIPDLRVDAEDSVSIGEFSRKGKADIVIAVPALPRISNFTDLAPLEAFDSVEVRSVRTLEDLAGADCILLPGTKSTMQDMQWLEGTRVAAAILELHHNQKIPVVGICGGYQMLGEQLLDPDGVEGSVPVQKGLGLLPVSTTFHPEQNKITSRVSGFACDNHPFLATGTPISGYEIHSGESITSRETPTHMITEKNGTNADEGDGTAIIKDSTFVLGTYIHGFFDTAEVALVFVNKLRQRRKLNVLRPEDAGDDARRERERSYATLAEELRRHVDLEKVFCAMKIPAPEKTSTGL